MQVLAYLPDKIFTGEVWLTDHAVVVAENFIRDIIPVSELTNSYSLQKLPKQILISAFIDIQIYGAFNRLLAIYPNPET